MGTGCTPPLALERGTVCAGWEMLSSLHSCCLVSASCNAVKGMRSGTTHSDSVKLIKVAKKLQTSWVDFQVPLTDCLEDAMHGAVAVIVKEYGHSVKAQ